MGRPSVHIVGAGVVGLALAAVLLQRGHAVTLIDRGAPGSETSRGNAAAIAWTDVAPLASPGIWRKIPGWLLDPLGPLSLRPSYAFTILPWMLRFVAAARPEQMRRSMTAIAALNGIALPAWEALWRASGSTSRVRREGCLDVFDDPGQLRRARSGWQQQRDHGIAVEELDGDAMRAMEPDLGAGVVGGAFLPGWMHVDDPHELCRDLEAYVIRACGEVLQGEIVDATSTEEGVCLRLRSGQALKAERVVFACGAWSRPFAKAFGDHVPLDTERGYNITVPDPGVSFRRFIMLPGYGFVLSPLSAGLRIGGAVEFAGLQAAPNWRRVDALVARAKRIVPRLRAEEGERWMGFRPSLPDSLPVLSRAKTAPNVYYAFGHGHHGLTQAAASAELMADLIEGRTPAIDMSPFRVDRF